MNPSRIPDCLEYMLEASTQACIYVENMAYETFLKDKRKQQAVVLNLILIGEESTKLLRDNEAFADQHPQVPWRSMKGMRNRIAHGYFEINMDTVWETVQTALPELIGQLRAIRASMH